MCLWMRIRMAFKRKIRSKMSSIEEQRDIDIAYLVKEFSRITKLLDQMSVVIADIDRRVKVIERQDLPYDAMIDQVNNKWPPKG